MPVDSAGFVQTDLFLEYTTSDCTGTQYTFQRPNALSTSVNVSVSVQGNTLYYPDKAVQSLTINSYQVTNADGSVGTCNAATFTDTVALVKTFDLSTLKLLPPFSLK